MIRLHIKPRGLGSDGVDASCAASTTSKGFALPAALYLGQGLFDRTSDEVAGDRDKLPARDVKKWSPMLQCKLCYNNCPSRRASLGVDFPRMMLRARASEARATGVRCRTVIGNTDLSEDRQPHGPDIELENG